MRVVSNPQGVAGAQAKYQRSCDDLMFQIQGDWEDGVGVMGDPVVSKYHPGGPGALKRSIDVKEAAVGKPGEIFSLDHAAVFQEFGTVEHVIRPRNPGGKLIFPRRAFGTSRQHIPDVNPARKNVGPADQLLRAVDPKTQRAGRTTRYLPFELVADKKTGRLGPRRYLHDTSYKAKGAKGQDVKIHVERRGEVKPLTMLAVPGVLHPGNPANFALRRAAFQKRRPRL